MLAAILVVTLAWIVPALGAASAPPHASAIHPVDPFERAGVNELEAGQHGPSFRLGTLTSGLAGLQDFEDKLVVLNFWATWCTPCTTEMPALEALWQRYRDRGVVVLAIDVDRGARPGDVDPYVKKLGLTFPILLDPDMRTAGAWHVAALPATFIVKPGGEVAAMAIGARAWDSAEVHALLDTLLAERGTAMPTSRPTPGGRAG